MIDIRVEDDGSLVTAVPTGKITEADVTALADAMSGSINTHDRIPALLIHASKFPGYDSFAALMAHLKLIHDRESLVPRVAVVSDGVLLPLGQMLARLFVRAEVRHFAEADLDEATEWARNGAEKPDGVTVLEGFPNDVLALEVHGRLHAVDYDEVIEPLVEEKLKRHDKLKLLIVVGKDFEGATVGAGWEDMKLGLRHFTRYDKLALVTDLHWLRNSARLFGPFMPGQVHTYPLFKRDLAEDWIKT